MEEVGYDKLENNLRQKVMRFRLHVRAAEIIPS
jgi:hypothetical protein